MIEESMGQRVYIETTIPSFYYEVRTEPEMIARRNWTRTWWDNRRHAYLLVTSEAIIEIVETYIRQMVMPHDPTGDALHLALASYHKYDFLLTWNVQHLANANKFAHIRRVNALLGLFTTPLVTPLELLA
jgi:hypothetical protein